MKRVLFLLLAIALLMCGCGKKQPEIIPDTGENGSDSTVRLADVDFVIVPEYIYHVLLEEKLSADHRSLLRRYAEYDGIKNLVSEETKEVVLPNYYKDAAHAKEWINSTYPEKLMLMPNTYVSHNVFAQWEEEEYNYETEEFLVLEDLLRRGAIARLNKMFSIPKDPEELVEVIESTEAQYLKNPYGLTVKRKLEPLPLSFSYQINLTLQDNPADKTSRKLLSASLNLFYRIDELGNPLDLVLSMDADYQNKLADMDPALLNDIGAFNSRMYENLVTRLGLYGVNASNYSLAYANVTLYYEGSRGSNQVSDRIIIR